MVPGYAACDCCLSAALVRGRPAGRIPAQVAADLPVPPLRFCSHFKFCAGRPCVTWPYPVCSFLLHRWHAPRLAGYPCRWSESTMTALRCFCVCARPPLPGPLLSTPKPSTNRRCAASVASHYKKACINSMIGAFKPNLVKHSQWSSTIITSCKLEALRNAIEKDESFIDSFLG